jgi:hypothetical protein
MASPLAGLWEGWVLVFRGLASPGFTTLPRRGKDGPVGYALA